MVTDDPEKYADMAAFAPGVTVHHPDELDHVQKTLREYAGVPRHSHRIVVKDFVCYVDIGRNRRSQG